MVKKIKRWYSNLTIYKRKEMFLNIAFILYFVLVITLDLLGFFGGHTFYLSAVAAGEAILGFLFDCVIFVWIAVIIFMPIDNYISDKKRNDELMSYFEKSKKTVKEYFEKSDTNILEIIPKSSKDISDIIDYYCRKGKIVESYWVELDEVDGESVCYISAICIGEANRLMYPETITNFGYLLDNFTFKD